MCDMTHSNGANTALQPAMIFKSEVRAAFMSDVTHLCVSVLREMRLNRLIFDMLDHMLHDLFMQILCVTSKVKHKCITSKLKGRQRTYET